MKNWFFLVVLLLFSLALHAQLVKRVYQESTEDFVNPERGFYLPTGTSASRFEGLDTARLRSLRNNLQRPAGASYQVRASLIYRGYELDLYKNSALPDSFLARLQQDFDAVRYAGLKMILRFAYTNTAKGGDCKDEYKICPPYGDAPRNVVLQHIEQLKPLLQKNADVIAVMQEGFIGIWGENYFTDYFGDASTNGLGIIADSSWRHRNQVLKALLDALPRSRMVQVRTPQIKQKFVYGPSAPVTAAHLSRGEALQEIDKARIGFHNDCLLATADDYGTYYDYGSSTQPRQPANATLRSYIEKDTKYTVVGGETCDDAFSPQNDCGPAGYAEEELRRMHYSYLNAGYNTAVNNDWDSAGCLHNIRRYLGYRLVLRKAVFTTSIKRGARTPLELVLENTGYAAPFNPRPIKIVFRNKKSGVEYAFTLQQNIRLLTTGTHRIRGQLRIPSTLPPGQYNLFLAMPDEAPSLSKRPEYSIRLANEKTWEAHTGYNILHQTIVVK